MGLLSRKNSNAFNGDGYFETTDPTLSTTAQPESVAPEVPQAGPGSFELKVVTPMQYDEVSGIADYLLSGKTVFLNVENTPKEIVRRMIDFLSGVAYSIGGNISKVTVSTYIIAPSNVDVADAMSEDGR